MSDSLLNDRRCPVCGAANECRIANGCLYKGPCWCEAASVPAVVQRYFADLGLEAACLCRSCLGHLAGCARGDDSANVILARVQAETARARSSVDSYFDENGSIVFTAAFHLKRGYCCGNGCRHCPYNPPVSRAPQRIVCLSAESADWLWRIGAWESVVGVTAFFSPPPNIASKPRVSGFSTGRLEEITALNPDLVITFSDVQAQLAAELIRRGLSVLSTNQRTLEEIEATLAMFGRVVDREAEAERLLDEFRERLAPVEHIGSRPRVYFEEWNDPFISGIAWVSELIERAGGTDIFAELRTRRAAPERVVSSEQVCHANPEIIFASWCGKPVQPAAIASRPDWSAVAAVRTGRIHEVPAEDILQPGFRLVYGSERLKEIIGLHVSGSKGGEGVLR